MPVGPERPKDGCGWLLLIVLLVLVAWGIAASYCWDAWRGGGPGTLDPILNHQGDHDR